MFNLHLLLLINSILIVTGCYFLMKKIFSCQWQVQRVEMVFLVAGWLMLSFLMGLFFLFDELEGSKESIPAIMQCVKTITTLIIFGFLIIYGLLLGLKKITHIDNG